MYHKAALSNSTRLRAFGVPSNTGFYDCLWNSLRPGGVIGLFLVCPERLVWNRNS